LLGLLVSVTGLRGTDWPAHLFRVELFREAGLTLWNGQWYGGHYTLGYSVIFPPLAAWFGPLVVGVTSSVVATACFDVLLRDRYGAVGAWATCWFAIGTALNLAVGRLPFALGMAFGIAALLAYERGLVAVAVLAAVCTPLASPVAGVFLGLAAGGLAIDQFLRRRAGEPHRLGQVVAIGAAATLPVLVAAALFPDPGIFPFRGAAFAGVMACSVGLVLILPRSERAVRLAAGLGGLMAVPVFLTANPMGGNLTRIAVLFVLPVLTAALWQRRRPLVIVATVPLALWLIVPGVADAEQMIEDPAAEAAYHAPLVEFVTTAPGPTGRVEIPFTRSHWEVAHVAPHLPIARGWERQVDLDRNAVLYAEELSGQEYRRWLDANAVRWVALPDVDLDDGGVAEAALLERGVPWLRLVHQTEHWRIWEVTDAKPIVAPPGRLVSETVDEIVIHVDRASTVLVRAWFMPYWSATGAEACVAPSDDGLLEVTVSEPGRVALRPVFSLEPALTSGGVDTCDGVSGQVRPAAPVRQD
jgi:hypothetical protein